jgi:hypothetical protein
MNWLGGRDSLGRFRETPMKMGHCRVNLVAPAVWHFRVLSPVFVYLRLFSRFAGTMTLAMTLAVKHVPDLLGANLHSAIERCPRN